MGEMTEESGQTRVLVTGATGAIGPRIVHALHQAGCLVGTFSLDAPAPGVFPDDVEVLRGDIADLPAVQAAVQGVEIIIHLAGLLHILNPTAGMRKKYESINVGGTAAVIEASLKAGVRRVVLFSTIAVYGYAHLDGGILNEDSSPRPDTVYGETKLAAERLLLNVRRHDGRPLGVVLRLGAVYGSRIKGNYQRLVHALAKRRFIPIGSGNNRRTLVYDKDVARAVVLAMRHPAAGGRIYNVTDGRFHTVAEIITAICTALGRNILRTWLWTDAVFRPNWAFVLNMTSRAPGGKPLAKCATQENCGVGNSLHCIDHRDAVSFILGRRWPSWLGRAADAGYAQ
ncbi:MAG: NAD-dependent epimerase/dehydratase family protein [Syntrophobacteraceae bacterium]